MKFFKLLVYFKIRIYINSKYWYFEATVCELQSPKSQFKNSGISKSICVKKACARTLKSRLKMVNSFSYPAFIFLKPPARVAYRAVARALIGGGGGVYIHIFVFCPTNFF